MGVLSLYMDAVGAVPESKLGPDGRLQPLFLDVWFLAWGAFCVWMGAGNGLAVADVLDKRVLRGFLRLPAAVPMGAADAEGGGLGMMGAPSGSV